MDNLDLKELEDLAEDTHADLQEKDKPKMRNNLKQDEEGNEVKTEVKKDSNLVVNESAATLATTQSYIDT